MKNNSVRNCTANLLFLFLFFLALTRNYYPAMANELVDYLYHRDQGYLYYNDKWYKDALQEFKIAASCPKGGKDFRTIMGLARTYYKLFNLKMAMKKCELAKYLAASRRQQMAASSFLKRIKLHYSQVKIEPDKPIPGQIKIELKLLSPFIMPEKKQYFKKKQHYLAETGVSLPAIIFLPVGEYLIQGQKLSLTREKTAVVKLDSLSAGPKNLLAQKDTTLSGKTISTFLGSDTNSLKSQEVKSFPNWYNTWWFYTAVSSATIIAGSALYYSSGPDKPEVKVKFPPLFQP